MLKPSDFKAILSSKRFITVVFLTLVIQMLVWEGHRMQPLPVGPAAGSPVPDLTVGTFDGPSDQGLRDLVSAHGDCTLLVIVSPTCPTCARMRVTWPNRFAAWADSVGSEVRPLWLGEGGKDEFLEFTREFILEGVELAFLPAGTTAHAYRVLGVLGTPTLYLVDSAGTVQAGLLGDVFPPVAIGRSACG